MHRISRHCTDSQWVDTQSHRRAVIFQPAQWACDRSASRSGRGCASAHGRLAGLTPPYSDVNYGHLLRRPGLGGFPGSPAVAIGTAKNRWWFWGPDRDPVILLRGGQTWPPVNCPFWFGWETASSHSGERRIISGSFRGLCVEILGDWWEEVEMWILVQEFPSLCFSQLQK